MQLCAAACVRLTHASPRSASAGAPVDDACTFQQEASAGAVPRSATLTLAVRLDSALPCGGGGSCAPALNDTCGFAAERQADNSVRCGAFA